MERDVIVIGGGLAGLSAAIYLARAQRSTLVVSCGRSMAEWEPDVQNYLGFPDGVNGRELVDRGREQAERFGAEFIEDEISHLSGACGNFIVNGKHNHYESKRLLLATGSCHIPPDTEGVPECLGHSLFFCKDCDGYRVQGKTVVVYGWTNETVEYALGMVLYSPVVAIATDGRVPRWDVEHRDWIKEYELPVYQEPILRLARVGGQIKSLEFEGGKEVLLEAMFTTRGDVYHNELAQSLGARLDASGQVEVNCEQATSVAGLYAAGCVTPANCQMIIAAGQGATAAQAINRDLFEESLRTHTLKRYRQRQLRTTETQPQAVRT